MTIEDAAHDGKEAAKDYAKDKAKDYAKDKGKQAAKSAGKKMAKEGGKAGVRAAADGASAGAYEAYEGAKKVQKAGENLGKKAQQFNKNFAKFDSFAKKQKSAEEQSKLQAAKNSKTGKAAIKAADLATNGVPPLQVAKQGFKALKIIIPIATMVVMLGGFLFLAMSMGSGDKADATSMAPGLYSTITVNEEDLDKALANPLLEGVNRNFLKFEVMAAARLEALVPGCKVRWQVMHAIAKHETPGFLSWEIDDNGDEVEWKLGGSPSGPDGNNPVSEWYTDPKTGEQWDKSTTQDFALGAYQMLPATWAGWKNEDGTRGNGYHSDGNGDGAENPHNVFDQFTASAKHLCPLARDTDPATINDWTQPDQTDWSTLGEILFHYAGGQDIPAQGYEFRDFVKEHTELYDAIEIRVTVANISTFVGGDGSCDGVKAAPAMYVEAAAAVQLALQQCGLSYVFAMPPRVGWTRYASPSEFGCPPTALSSPEGGEQFSFTVDTYQRGCFDCSGLTGWVYGQFGVNLSGGATDQYRAGPQVSLSELQPGDLVFFGNPNRAHHVGMYIGNGMYIHAPKSTDHVKVSPLAGRSDAFAGSRPVMLVPGGPTPGSGSTTSTTPNRAI